MKTVKKFAKWIGIVGLSLVAIVAVFYFIYVRPVLNKIEEERIVEVDNKVTIYEGGGGNSGLIVSDSLVIVIDSKMGDAAQSFAAKVREVAAGRPILVVNTHYHIDHTQGNDLYAGQKIIAGGGYDEKIWVEEAAKDDMPTEWLKDRKDIRIDDDTVTLLTLNMKSHTVGDVFVYLHKRKILFGGDVILNGQVPSVANGDPQGYLTVFDILEKQFDIKTIVPGHGATGDIQILNDFRQYFHDMKLAAGDESKSDEMKDKYKSWTQVPMMMSSGNVIDGFKK